MPNRDGTGPKGEGPKGRGYGRAASPQGATVCTCSKCGHQAPHQKAIPCSQTTCLECNVLMKGEYCK